MKFNERLQNLRSAIDALKTLRSPAAASPCSKSATAHVQLSHHEVHIACIGLIRSPRVPLALCHTRPCIQTLRTDVKHSDAKLCLVWNIPCYTSVQYCTLGSRWADCWSYYLWLYLLSRHSLCWYALLECRQWSELTSSEILDVGRIFLELQALTQAHIARGRIKAIMWGTYLDELLDVAVFVRLEVGDFYTADYFHGSACWVSSTRSNDAMACGECGKYPGNELTTNYYWRSGTTTRLFQKRTDWLERIVEKGRLEEIQNGDLGSCHCLSGFISCHHGRHEPPPLSQDRMEGLRVWTDYSLCKPKEDGIMFLIRFLDGEYLFPWNIRSQVLNTETEPR